MANLIIPSMSCREFMKDNKAPMFDKLFKMNKHVVVVVPECLKPVLYKKDK